MSGSKSIGGSCGLPAEPTGALGYSHLVGFDNHLVAVRFAAGCFVGSRLAAAVVVHFAVGNRLAADYLAAALGYFAALAIGLHPLYHQAFAVYHQSHLQLFL